MKIKTIHVDDDISQLSYVSGVLSKIPEIEQVGKFKDAKQALDYVTLNEVNLAILDVEMNEEDGFWLADHIKERNISIVFLTGHADYAVQAFEACALHYILKPVDLPHMLECVQRYKNFNSSIAQQNNVQSEQISEINNYFNKNLYPQRIFIHNVHKTTILTLSDVLFISANGSYTEFKTKEGQLHVSSKNLKIYSDVLKSHPDFVRIHRGYIVNKNYLKSILRDKHSMYAVMADETTLEVSPLRKEQIYDELSR